MAAATATPSPGTHVKRNKERQKLCLFLFFNPNLVESITPFQPLDDFIVCIKTRVTFSQRNVYNVQLILKLLYKLDADVVRGNGTGTEVVAFTFIMQYQIAKTRFRLCTPFFSLGSLSRGHVSSIWLEIKSSCLALEVEE